MLININYKKGKSCNLKQDLVASDFNFIKLKKVFTKLVF